MRSVTSLTLQQVMRAGRIASAKLPDGTGLEYAQQAERHLGDVIEVRVLYPSEPWRTGAVMQEGQYCVEIPPTTFQVIDKGELVARLNAPLRRMPIPADGWQHVSGCDCPVCQKL